MLRKFWPVILMISVALWAIGCGDDSNGGRGDTDSGSDGIGDTGPKVRGTVLSPNGVVPIEGALVYLLAEDGKEEPFPTVPFCDEYINTKSGKFGYSFSEPDGTFVIRVEKPGDYTLVTRKGLYRRQVTITVDDGDTYVDDKDTTLPAVTAGDDLAIGIDEAPRIALLDTRHDNIEDTLAKFGLGELIEVEDEVIKDLFWWRLDPETAVFDIYDDLYLDTDPDTDQDTEDAAYKPSSLDLFADAANLDQYQIIILPDQSHNQTTSVIGTRAQMLRDYVEKGGRLHVSNRASQWIEYPYPDMVTFAGAQTPPYVGDRGAAFDTVASVHNPGLRRWLSVEAADVDLEAFPINESWIRIMDVNQMLDTDSEWIEPFEPVLANGLYDELIDPFEIWLTDQTEDPQLAYQVDDTLSFSYRAGNCGEIYYNGFSVSPPREAEKYLLPTEYIFLSQLMHLWWEARVE